MKKENPFKYLGIILIAKPDKDSTKNENYNGYFL